MLKTLTSACVCALLSVNITAAAPYVKKPSNEGAQLTMLTEIYNKSIRRGKLINSDPFNYKDPSLHLDLDYTTMGKESYSLGFTSRTYAPNNYILNKQNEFSPYIGYNHTLNTTLPMTYSVKLAHYMFTFYSTTSKNDAYTELSQTLSMDFTRAKMKLGLSFTPEYSNKTGKEAYASVKLQSIPISYASGAFMMQGILGHQYYEDNTTNGKDYDAIELEAIYAVKGLSFAIGGYSELSNIKLKPYVAVRFKAPLSKKTSAFSQIDAFGFV